MIHRNRKQVAAIQWGNGESYRMITQQDGMGFGVCHTIVNAGSESPLQYRRHLEACYCISGSGKVLSADRTITYELESGAIYALDQNDAHYLIADAGEDLHLISVFNPPLTGMEKHQLSADGFSQY